MWVKSLAGIVVVANALFFNSDAKAVDNQTTPNILIIMVDDLGHDDLSVHQHPTIETPSIDALASDSVRFTDFTVTPVCATTRAALLTGRHPYKTGVSGVHGGRDFLSKDEILISNYLKAEGYRTGTWGKWHSGKTEGYFPWNRGFDDAYYAELYQHKNSVGWHNGKYVEHNQWVSEVITDYVIDFVDASDDTPFFAYASYLAPHEPWLAPERYVQKFTEQGYRPAIANLYGMIEEADDQIGRLLNHLEATGKRDNTLVIFLSDNGPWWDSSNFGAMTQEEWQARNPSKLNGNKGQVWQNGVKSPLFVSLPSRFSATDVNRYIDVKDILPTVLDVIGAEPLPTSAAIDGQSFLAYLNGNTTGENTRATLLASHDVKSDKHLFNQWTPIDEQAREQMQYGSQVIGLRTETHKLILNPAMDREYYPAPAGQYLLFDMQNDPLETTNIFNTAPKVATALTAQLEQAFVGIVEAQNSFKTPIYEVNEDSSIAVINGFGPSATRGDTLSRPHHLSAMASAGDEASYTIDSQVSGKYQLYITQESTDGAGIVVDFAIGSQSYRIELDGTDTQYVGTFELSPGMMELTLSVQKNNSIKPWSAITKLRRLVLVEEGKENLVHSISHPY